jgi:peptidoglycan/LPS O-acetylase OafA/YrhL
MPEAQIHAVPARLSRNTIVALDAGRAAAAFYVVLYHLAAAREVGGVLRLALGFGQEAVIVFFVLSGFVIFANEHHRVGQTGKYLGRRLRRIVPPLLAAMLVSTLVTLSDGTFAADFNWRDLIGTLAFVEDIDYIKPGVLADPYLHNNPLWSLSYEMAFYLAFPVVMAALRRWPRATGHMVGAAACLAYGLYALFPNHWALVAAYFLPWWAGASAAQAYLEGRKTLAALLTPLSWLAALCGVAALVVARTHPLPLIGYYPVLMLRHFATALLLLAVLYGPVGRAIARLLTPFAAPIAFAASISYGIYVIHYPLLIQWSAAHGLGSFALAFALVLAGSTLIDRQLTLWMRRFR